MPADAFEPDDDSLRELDEVHVRLEPFLTPRVGFYVVGRREYELGYDDFTWLRTERCFASIRVGRRLEEMIRAARRRR